MGRLLKMLKYHIMERHMKFSTILEDIRNEKVIRSITNIFDRTILQNSANDIFSKIVEIMRRFTRILLHNGNEDGNEV